MEEYGFIDLHLHTEHSKEPSVDMSVEKMMDNLEAKAEQMGKDICFSITDHESILGCVEAKRLFKENPEKYKHLKFIPGIELNVSLSCFSYKGKKVIRACHMLGYNYDVNNKDLSVFSKLFHFEFVSCPYNYRLHNNQKMIHEAIGKYVIRAKEKFEYELGEKIPYSALGPILECRSYEAVKNTFNAIAKQYVPKGMEKEYRSYYKTIWKNDINVNSIINEDFRLNLSSIIKMLKSAHAKVGIAHCNQTTTHKENDNSISKLDFLDKVVLATLQKDSDLKLDFLEVFHRSNTEKLDKIFEMARKYDLYITCGSDYHGASIPINKAQISQCFSSYFERASKPEEIKQIRKIVNNRITALPFVDNIIKGKTKCVDKQDFICRDYEDNLVDMQRINTIRRSSKEEGCIKTGGYVKVATDVKPVISSPSNIKGKSKKFENKPKIEDEEEYIYEQYGNVIKKQNRYYKRHSHKNNAKTIDTGMDKN